MSVIARPNLGANSQDRREFILFVAEGETNSIKARRNFERILVEFNCDHKLTVSDVFKEFELAAKHSVLVIPCLVMIQPKPTVTVIGTLKDKNKVCRALRLE